jgi:hypothetical protein
MDAEHHWRRSLRDIAETACRSRQAERDLRALDHVAINDEIRDLIAQRNQAQNTLSAITATLTNAWQCWPDCVPDPAVYGADRDAIQLCTPWADAAFTTARNQVTLEALRLHKAFILGAARQIFGNLSIAAAVLEGNPRVGDEALRA